MFLESIIVIYVGLCTCEMTFWETLQNVKVQLKVYVKNDVALRRLKGRNPAQNYNSVAEV